MFKFTAKKAQPFLNLTSPPIKPLIILLKSPIMELYHDLRKAQISVLLAKKSIKIGLLGRLLNGSYHLRKAINNSDLSINIADDFSKFPHGRYNSHGPFNGEKFRNDILLEKIKKAINTNKKLSIHLDGARGYPISFIDEAFGGLVRECNLKAKDILGHIDICFKNSIYEMYKYDIEESIKDAEAEVKAQ